MTELIQRTMNSYDNPITPLGITLNTSNYTKLLDANDRRIGYKITNLSNNTILVVEKVPEDNQDRGFAVFGRMVYESQTDNSPNNEIHAKSLSGDPTILIQEQ